MVKLPEQRILDVWEQGESLHLIDRTLLLLSSAYTDIEWQQLASLSLGERDALLLRLRSSLTGPVIQANTTCPQCTEHAEIDVDIPQLLARASIDKKQVTITVKESGYQLHGRLPNSYDLAAAAQSRDVLGARKKLIEHCIERAEKDSQPVKLDDVPEQVITKLAHAMEIADPLSDISVKLTCPSCGHSWDEVLDISTFLWDEIDQHARRILQQVHLLAQAYGWTEQDVLAMSGRRRQAYVEMAYT